MTIVRGIDGCKAGWLAAAMNLGTGEASFRVFADAEARVAARNIAAEIEREAEEA